MVSNPAPIAFFAFKRAESARNALRSLKACRGSEKSYLRIYCDGPRSEADRAKVEEVRRVVRSEAWCGKVDVVEQAENRGLSKSIRAGVTELCEEFGKVIVLEDDLVLHSSFLEYMNDALERYENDPRVFSVSGYNYPLEFRNPSADAFFAPHASCWGWGTWKRAWSRFDDSKAFLGKLEKDSALRKRFDLGGAYPYTDLLRKQHAGEVDSWGILWHQTIVGQDGLVLMPNRTLVCNLGAGADSTHEAGKGYPDVMGETEVRRFPEAAETPGANTAIGRYLAGFFRRPLLSRAPFSWVRSLLSGEAR
jgi:hypothetical protein